MPWSMAISVSVTSASASYLEFSPERAFDTHGRGIALARNLSFTRLEYQGSGNEVIAVCDQ